MSTVETLLGVIGIITAFSLLFLVVVMVRRKLARRRVDGPHSYDEDIFNAQGPVEGDPDGPHSYDEDIFNAQGPVEGDPDGPDGENPHAFDGLTQEGQRALAAADLRLGEEIPKLRGRFFDDNETPPDDSYPYEGGASQDYIDRVKAYAADVKSQIGALNLSQKGGVTYKEPEPQLPLTPFYTYDADPSSDEEGMIDPALDGRTWRDAFLPVNVHHLYFQNRSLDNPHAALEQQADSL